MYWLLFDGNLVKLDRGVCHSVSSHWTELEICNIIFFYGEGGHDCIWVQMIFGSAQAQMARFIIITDCIILLFFYNRPIIAVSHHFTFVDFF